MASTRNCRPADPPGDHGRCRGTGRRVVPLLLVLLAACAAVPPPAPRIDRLPGGAPPPAPAAATAVPSPSPAPTPTLRSPPPPAASPLSLDEIVALVRSGAGAEAVVRRWREDGARLRPGAAVLLELHARGVPPAVLDALIEARETALRIDADSRLVAQQARFDADLAAERARPRVCPAPVWSPYPLYPYGGWRRPGGWGGGIHWGW